LKKIFEISFLKRIIFICLSIIFGGLIGKLLIGKTFEVILLYSNDVSNFSQILIYIILAAFSLIFGILLFKYKYRANFKEYLFLSFFSALYLTVKIELNIQEVVLWPVWENLGLIDCFFVVFFTFLISSSFWNDRHKKIKVSTNLFLEDRHNGTNDNEESYTHLINQIEPILFKDHFQSSFSVGIVGSWGIGKSSLINSIERKITQSNRNDIIFLKFSPTLNHNQDQLINEFFLNLSNQLKYRNGFLSKDLKSYSGKLVELLDKKGLTFLLNALFPDDLSISEYFEKISKEIEKQDLKIIISIDDLDRLTPDEIYEVLKLIRNTSNFPNTIFLVALDKEYVIDAIKGKQDFMDDRFLDKYFQLELHVSKIPEVKLIDFISNNLELLLERRGCSEITRKYVSSCIKDPSLSLPEYIQNYRDSKRFINQFLLDYSLINDDLNTQEVDLLDFIRMTIIKLQYPKIFNQFIYNKDLFKNSYSEFIYLKAFIFPDNPQEGTKDRNDLTIDDLTIDDLTKESHFPLPLIAEDRNKISRLIKDTFLLMLNESTITFDQNISPNSLKRESVYRLYFERSLSNHELKLNDFNILFNNNIEILTEKILGFSREKALNLLDKLNDFRPTEESLILKKLTAIQTCFKITGRLDDENQERMENEFLTAYRIYFLSNPGQNLTFILNCLNDDDINNITRSSILRKLHSDNDLYNMSDELILEISRNLLIP
jgi:hypothetical protein